MPVNCAIKSFHLCEIGFGETMVRTSVFYLSKSPDLSAQNANAKRALYYAENRKKVIRVHSDTVQKRLNFNL